MTNALIFFPAIIYFFNFNLFSTHTDDISNNNHGNEAQNTQNNNMNSTNHDQIIHPCNFTSSIYYGGQDIIPNTQTTQNAGVTSFVSSL